MSIKILPVTYPTITTFPPYAAALSILSNYAESYDWIYSHYIQIYVLDLVNRYSNQEKSGVPYIACFFGDFDNRRLANTICDFFFLRREECPYLDIFEIPNELINSLGESVVSILKKNIDLDMYIYTYLDVSKIKQYNAKYEYGHEVFIFGYDDSKRLFHFADFPINDSTKYSYSTCSYEEVEAAFKSMEHQQFPLAKSIGIAKYTNLSPYFMDYSYIKDTIKEYIYPDIDKENKFNSYTMSYYYNVNWKTKTYIGVDVYTYLLEFIDCELCNGQKVIDVRLYHAMYDHKEMMVKRFGYMLEKGYIKIEKKVYIDRYCKVRDNALVIRNLVTKYNIAKTNGIISKIKSLLSETKVCEIELLKLIFDID